MSDLDSNLQVLDAKARQDQLTEQAKAEARARHNHNKFLQIDKKAIAELRKLMVQHVGACNVLMMLAEKMNRQNAIVMSYDAMMKMTGYSKSSITKAIAVLKKGQWIEVIKIGTANAYRINSRAFWQSYGDLKYTSFRVEIIAFSDEQPKGVVDCKTKLKTFPVIEVDEEVILVDKMNHLPMKKWTFISDYLA